MKELNKNPQLNGVYGSIKSLVHRGYPNYPSKPAEFLEWYMNKKPKNAEVILENIPYFMETVFKLVKREEKKRGIK